MGPPPAAASSTLLAIEDDPHWTSQPQQHSSRRARKTCRRTTASKRTKRTTARWMTRCRSFSTKCECMECKIPSAQRGGQKTETENHGCSEKPIDQDANFKVVSRKAKTGKCVETYLLGNGKFLMSCSAKKSENHYNLIQKVLAEIKMGNLTTVEKAKQYLLESVWLSS